MGVQGSEISGVIKCAGDLKTGSLGFSPQIINQTSTYLSLSIIERLHYSHLIDEEVMLEEIINLPKASKLATGRAGI